MTNEEYVLHNYIDDITYYKEHIKLLCPKDFDARLEQFEGCEGDCIECWNLEVKK